MEDTSRHRLDQDGYDGETEQLQKWRRRRKRYQKGKDVEKKRLERDQRADYSSSSTTKYQSARTLHQAQRYAEAEPLLRQSIEMMEKTLGLDHVQTLLAKQRLGHTLLKLHKYAESEQLLQLLAEQHEEVLGADHMHTIQSKRWLAQALYKLEMHAESEQLLSEVIPLNERVLGVYHKNTLTSRYWLAKTLYHQQKYSEAKSALQQLEEQVKKAHSPGHGYARETKRLLHKTIVAMKPPLLADASANQELSSEVDVAMTLATPVNSIASREVSREAIPTKAQIASTSSLEDTVQSRLSDFFTENDRRQTSYTDSEIQRVSTLLSQFNLQWSKVPRIYIVLRTIGCLELLNTFIDLGYCDHWFPITERSLPPSLRPSKRSEFVAAQDLIMTKSIDLEKGQHCFFRKDRLPLKMKEILGSGAYGQVNRVLSSISFQEYALKRVPRSTVFGGRGTEFVKRFIAEIQVLKRIKHDHVVEFIGSYTDPKHMGLLMLPVADMDLSTYLERADITKHRELRTFFGCLARTLEFLHEQKIRHKDIKPSNILVHGEKVLYTDFGLALDFTDKDGSTTGSMVNGRTAKYCAPEVADCESRNTSSDIWSLGVVFLEMTAVLKGKTVGYVYEFLKAHGTGQAYVRTNPTGTCALITELKATGSPVDNAALGWVQDMIMLDQRLRPTAASLIDSIIDVHQNGDGKEAFCGICCVSHDDLWSDLDELDMMDTN